MSDQVQGATSASGPAPAAGAIGAQDPARVRRLLVDIGVPLLCVLAIVATAFVAPTTERSTIFWSTLIGLAAGLASTAVGVYGGILVPGLLLLGIDPRFAAAASLFLQVLVIPVGAGAHRRSGNFSRSIFIPLVITGVIFSFIGPFVASALPKDVIARFVAVMIIGVGVFVLGTMRLRGLGQVRPEGDVPNARVASIGAVAGFSSGVAGTGWGPIGITLLILSRLDAAKAVGSSLAARFFMAASAVLAYVIGATAFKGIQADFWVIIPLLAASIAPMIAGATLVSKLGRERVTIAVTVLSIGLAVPTLLFGH